MKIERKKAEVPAEEEKQVVAEAPAVETKPAEAPVHADSRGEPVPGRSSWIKRN